MEFVSIAFFMSSATTICEYTPCPSREKAAKTEQAVTGFDWFPFRLSAGALPASRTLIGSANIHLQAKDVGAREGVRHPLNPKNVLTLRQKPCYPVKEKQGEPRRRKVRDLIRNIWRFDSSLRLKEI